MDRRRTSNHSRIRSQPNLGWSGWPEAFFCARSTSEIWPDLTMADHPARPYLRDGERGDAMNVGAVELIIVLVIVVLLFGARKLPDLARSIGRSQREFHKG